MIGISIEKLDFNFSLQLDAPLLTYSQFCTSVSAKNIVDWEEKLRLFLANGNDHNVMIVHARNFIFISKCSLFIALPYHIQCV